MSWFTDQDREAESLNARLPVDQPLRTQKEKPTQEERHAGTERRWRRFCIIVLLLVAAILTVMGLLVLQSNLDQGTPGIGTVVADGDALVGSAWRDRWAHMLAKGTDPIRTERRKPIPPADMRWFETSVSQRIGPCACLYFARPRPSEPPENWSGLPMQSRLHGCSFSPRTLPRNVLFFHGASVGNEAYQDDLKRFATEFNVNLASIEFPGFEQRKPFAKATEGALLQHFPVEIDEVVTGHLRWRWSDTIVWANCFGVPIALNALWQIGRKGASTTIATMPAALMLTKTLVSHRYSLNELFGRKAGKFLSQMIPPHLYSLLPSGHGKEREMLPGQKLMYEYFSCPVIMAAAANDKLCSLASNRKLLEQFVNSCDRRLVPLPDMGHTANMCAMVARYRQIAYRVNSRQNIGKPDA